MTRTQTPPPPPVWLDSLVKKAGADLDWLTESHGRVREFLAAHRLPTLPHLDEPAVVRHYWTNDSPSLPPLNPRSVEWLVGEAMDHGGTDLLTVFALNPTWAGFPARLSYDRHDQVLREAFRIVVGAAALNCPDDPSCLWNLKECESVWENHRNRLRVFTALTSRWAAVTRSEIPFAATPSATLHRGHAHWRLFHDLIRHHPLEEHARMEGHGRDLSIQAAFLAWKEQAWSAAMFRSLLDEPLFDASTLIQSPERQYASMDPDFERFLTDAAHVTRRTLDLMLEAGDLELAAPVFWSIEPTLPAADVVMKIARSIEAGDSTDPVVWLMRPLKAPGTGVNQAIGELRQLSPKTLASLLRQRSEWVPLILDAMKDRKLADVLRTAIGTFSEPLLPPDLGGRFQGVTFPALHPGRAPCGFTNLQPFFDMLASTPVSTLKKALPILRQTDACDEDTANYMVYHLGLPSGRQRLEEPGASSWIPLGRRIPLNAADREEQLTRRAAAFARDYFSTQARTTVASEPYPKAFRWAMCAHAESAGFPSIDVAALDSARRWMASPSLEIDGIVLRKCPESPEGLRVSKGKRELKAIPRVIERTEQVAQFRAEAFVLWQARQAFEESVLNHYIETGEFEEEAGFAEAFGYSVAGHVRERIARPVPVALMHEFKELLESDASSSRVLETVPALIPSETFPELIGRGWQHALGRWHYNGIGSTYGPGGSLNLILEPHPADPREEKKQGSTPPSTPQRLHASFHPLRGPDVATAEVNARVLGLILQDLLDAFPSIGG